MGIMFVLGGGVVNYINVQSDFYCCFGFCILGFVDQVLLWVIDGVVVILLIDIILVGNVWVNNYMLV